MVPSSGVRWLLFLFTTLALARSPESPEDDHAQAAADEHERRAQQALTDSLTDAIAMLHHGSITAKEQAAHGIAQMAVETTLSQPFHPVTFRNACVRSGVVEELAALISSAAQSTSAKLHALTALEAIATDDPSTDLDNGHALAVCNAGDNPLPWCRPISREHQALHSPVMSVSLPQESSRH